MRTYDDSFSGQKIYPGKVRYIAPPRHGARHPDVEIPPSRRQQGGG
jgi:hypothetical protein